MGTSERDRAGLERFKLLRYRLYRLREQRALRSVLVTSAIPREGKSMVAANLAATLAQATDQVLLVDADLRRPSLDSFLGLKVDRRAGRFSSGAGGTLLARAGGLIPWFCIPQRRPFPRQSGGVVARRVDARPIEDSDNDF